MQRLCCSPFCLAVRIERYCPLVYQSVAVTSVAVTNRAVDVVSFLATSQGFGVDFKAFWESRDPLVDVFFVFGCASGRDHGVRLEANGCRSMRVTALDAAEHFRIRFHRAMTNTAFDRLSHRSAISEQVLWRIFLCDVRAKHLSLKFVLPVHVGNYMQSRLSVGGTVDAERRNRWNQQQQCTQQCYGSHP